MAEGRQPDDGVVWLLCAVSFIESADSAVLAASMISLEEDMGLSMADLSILYAGGGLAISVFGVVWGVLADRMPRRVLLASSCVGWGFCSLLGSMAQSAAMLFVLRWAQQIMLSSMGPIAQSVIADAYEPQRRGTMNGRLAMGGSLGNLLVKPLALAVSDSSLWFGIKGWRAMMALIGLFGLLAACLLLSLMAEPERAALHRTASPTGMCVEELTRFRRLLRIPSFAMLLGQGIFGCMAMFARGFELVYLKHCGHSGASIGTITLFTGMASLVAAPLNGAIPDFFSQRSAEHGRPCAAQISVLLGALAFVTWVLLAARIEVAGLTALMCLEVLVGGWVTPGVKLPILSEIVNPAERATTMAFLASLEGCLGGLLGPPLVGFLAEDVFGYRAVGDISTQSIGDREGNRRALRSALLWCTMLPWLIQAAIFFPLLHCTYWKDTLEAKVGKTMSSKAAPYELADQNSSACSDVSGNTCSAGHIELGKAMDLGQQGLE